MCFKKSGWSSTTIYGRFSICDSCTKRNEEKSGNGKKQLIEGQTQNTAKIAELEKLRKDKI